MGSNDPKSTGPPIMSGPENLTTLIYKALSNVGSNPAFLPIAVQRYVQINFAQLSDVEKQQMISNLKRSVADDNMSWKNFLRALEIIGVKEVEIGMHARFGNDKTANSSIQIHFSGKPLNVNVSDAEE